MRKIALTLIALAPGCAFALSSSYTGTFSDPNQVFEVSFTLSSGAPLLIQTYGYGGSVNAPGGVNGAGAAIAAGGFDPYVSLFAGTGPSATFLASDDDGACGPGFGATNLGNCFDSTLSLAALPAGSYTLALTQPNNFSIAENYGSGTLGDGFINLAGDFTDSAGNPRTGAYAVDISFPSFPLPEAGSLFLLAPALAAACAIPRCRRREVP